MSKKCPKCKAEIDEDAKVCPYCNEPLTFWERHKASRKKKEEKKEQCCGCTVPQGCSPCSCTIATTPFLVTLSIIVWSGFLYSVGTLHYLLSLVEVKGFYQKCVRFYQEKISSRTAPRCNLDPTCSEYSIRAVDQNGIWEGVSLTVDRLQQCAEARGETSKKRAF